MSSLTTLFSNLRAFYAARHEPENMRPLAEWYWRVLLTACVFATGGILMYGTAEFVGVVQNVSENPSGSRSAPPTILDRKQLTDTLAAYGAKEGAFSEAKKRSTPLTDPSK